MDCDVAVLRAQRFNEITRSFRRKESCLGKELRHNCAWFLGKDSLLLCGSSGLLATSSGLSTTADLLGELSQFEASVLSADHDLEPVEVSEASSLGPQSDLLGNGGVLPLLLEVDLLSGSLDGGSAGALEDGDLDGGEAETLQGVDGAGEVGVNNFNNHGNLAKVLSEVHVDNSSWLNEVSEHHFFDVTLYQIIMTAKVYSLIAMAREPFS
ncbi:hypothetical protein FGO68_gene10900 [Halteria grandinella]|uniref:Uncharacterized protein n=1 Tax=Halteria grandinella TaxID=5974 RepID=A0A8J8NLB3_HALGN|nr:hypothetical protein FGO68_gene10900 [Halteria grandinella]